MSEMDESLPSRLMTQHCQLGAFSSRLRATMAGPTCRARCTALDAPVRCAGGFASGACRQRSGQQFGWRDWKSQSSLTSKAFLTREVFLPILCCAGSFSSGRYSGVRQARAYTQLSQRLICKTRSRRGFRGTSACDQPALREEMPSEAWHVRQDERAGKPMLRGVSHSYTIFAAFAAGAVLLTTAKTSALRLAAGIYVCTLVNQFSMSTLYHRPNWGPRGRDLLRRLDRASIYLLIAGT